MQLARKFEVSVATFLLYSRLARVYSNLLIEKNIQLRHTYLKVAVFSIALGKSRLTRISLLAVFVTVRDLYSFV